MSKQNCSLLVRGLSVHTNSIWVVFVSFPPPTIFAASQPYSYNWIPIEFINVMITYRSIKFNLEEQSCVPIEPFFKKKS